MSGPTLGAVDPRSLVDARLQLHHAAQVVACAGVTFLEPRPDDGHPNFAWSDPAGALVGRPLPARGAQAALQVADLSLLLLDGAGVRLSAFTLAGRTLEDGYAWLSEAVAQAGETLPASGLARPGYELPSHPVAEGGAFSHEPREAFGELSRWFANASHALGAIAERTPGASELRVWPHHFDLGALIVVETQPDGSLAKSVGIGLSPGDESYAEPYAYVSPWPYPESHALPKLDTGHWHSEGHTSAILTGTEIVSRPPAQRGDTLRRFLEAAVEASRSVLAR